MTDREKVIKALEAHGCGKSMWRVCSICEYDKEECIKDRCRDNLLTDAYALLKEQEAVKPVRDEKTGRFWLCGNCGEYVGFEDNDPSDPNEFDNFCRNCGRKVKWG